MLWLGHRETQVRLRVYPIHSPTRHRRGEWQSGELKHSGFATVAISNIIKKGLRQSINLKILLLLILILKGQYVYKLWRSKIKSG